MDPALLEDGDTGTDVAKPDTDASAAGAQPDTGASGGGNDAPAAGADVAAKAEPAAQPAVDVAAIDAEKKGDEDAAAAAAPTTTEPTAAEKPDRWTAIIEALGDVPDEPNEKVIGDLTAAEIEKLPPAAKAVLRNLAAERNRAVKSADTKLADERKALTEERAALERDGRALLDREAQLAALFNSEAFKQIVAKADDKTEIDPLTPDGQKELIRRAAAENFRDFAKDFVGKATEIQRRADYLAFKGAHPRMNDETFVKEMVAIKGERDKLGVTSTWQDLHDLAEHRVLQREDRARREAERKAREESTRHVARETASLDTEGGPIPSWVATKGYKGETGLNAEIAYLKDHPKAVAAVRNQHRATRGAPA